MIIKNALKKLVLRESLSAAEMAAVMRVVMSGEASAAQIGGLLMGLAVKGESIDEIQGAVTVMRELVTPVIVDTTGLVDTCGTGGDGAKTFNISTAAALVVAAAGGRVAKHGNRAVSSRSGSADVLEAAGVHLELTPPQLAQCLQSLGVVFLFAPRHHGALRHAVQARADLGVRTLFNLLGPLTNPARAPNQVMGVYERRWLRPLAEVLGRLGSRHVLMVQAEDGMDEISISAATHVVEWRDGHIAEFVFDPRSVGMTLADRRVLEVLSVEDSLRLLKQGLVAGHVAVSDIVALNAGAALYASGRSTSLVEGIALAQATQAQGLALGKLHALVELTQALGGRG